MVTLRYGSAFIRFSHDYFLRLARPPYALSSISGLLREAPQVIVLQDNGWLAIIGTQCGHLRIICLSSEGWVTLALQGEGAVNTGANA